MSLFGRFSGVKNRAPTTVTEFHILGVQKSGFRGSKIDILGVKKWSKRVKNRVFGVKNRVSGRKVGKSGSKKGQNRSFLVIFGQKVEKS